MSRYEHGTITAYNKDRCRCEPCRDANREHNRLYRKRARKRGVPDDAEHGFARVYKFFGCRCWKCATAQWVTNTIMADKHRDRRRAERAERQQRLAAARSDAEHGTIGTYDTLECRCERCVKTHDLRRAAARRELAERDPSVVPHGTKQGYEYWFCRCDACTAANADDKARVTAARRERGIPDNVEHGTAYTYGYYGCRCDACYAAQSERNRAYKAKRRKERSSS